MAKWLEITIKTTAEAAEAVADLLLREGAAGIATENPEDIKAVIQSADSSIFTDPDYLEELPDYVRVRAYFAQDDKPYIMQKITVALEAMRDYLDVGEGLTASAEVHEEDWENSWKEHYHPLNISEHLTISPSWEDYQPKADELVITLDPGSAFGTGEHATTALCLRALEQLSLSGQTLLDLGCGSGILAIAAALMGAETVEGLDTDANAVKVAQANAELNDCARDIYFHVGELPAASQPQYDVIVANILAEVHVSLAKDYAARLKNQGTLVLGGIIEHKCSAVKEAIAQATELQLREEVSEAGWHMLRYEQAGVL